MRFKSAFKRIILLIKNLKVAGKHKKQGHHHGGGGLRVFWFPSKSHKHKKNKYYVSSNSREDSPTRSIMSGDSPNRDDFFEFPKDGRSSPTPTSSKDVGIQSGIAGNTVAQASILVDPKEQKDKDKDDKDKDKEDDILNSPTSNNSSHDEKDNDKTLPLEDSFNPDKDRKDDKDRGDDKKDKNDKNGDKKLNGDRLDGVWVPTDKKSNDIDFGNDKDDNNCLVQCLYYSMQCCDCNII